MAGREAWLHTGILKVPRQTHAYMSSYRDVFCVITNKPESMTACWSQPITERQSMKRIFKASSRPLGILGTQVEWRDKSESVRINSHQPQ